MFKKYFVVFRFGFFFHTDNQATTEAAEVPPCPLEDIKSW